MKTATLRHLAETLAEVRHQHLASALLETDPVRQTRERNKAFRVEGVLDEVRNELSIRETHGVRTPDAVRRADDRLERVLATFLGFSDSGARQQAADPGLPRAAGKPPAATATRRAGPTTAGACGVRDAAVALQAAADAPRIPGMHRPRQAFRRQRAP